jgi:16S rRNA (cytosine967-C5)-methyltransferase
MAARHRPVAEALKDWGLSHRFAGSGDRAAIGNLVYDALRRKLSYGWRMGDDTPLGLVTAVLLDGWGENEGSLREKLYGDRFAPELPALESLMRRFMFKRMFRNGPCRFCNRFSARNWLRSVRR